MPRTGETDRAVQHAEPLPDPFPWRAATLVACTVAVAELVALIATGALLLARPTQHRIAAAKQTTVAHARAVHRAPVRVPHVVVASRPLRARSKVRVLVLNGNGRQGAAHTEAVRLQSLGYRIGGAANADRHDYAQSMVMFVPGWAKEARRLARDAGIRLVAPVDGLTPAALRSSRVVVLLGS